MESDVIRLNVAGLALQLDARGCPFALTILPGHEKFTQPVAFPQADFNILSCQKNYGVEKTLELTVHDQPPSGLKIPGVLLSRTEIWELWLDEDLSNYTFFAPRGKPPCRLVVDYGFKTGEVSGDFSSLAGNSCYPLLGLDNLLYVNWLASMGDSSLHASAVLINGRGYAFFGVSGAGKSTLAETLALHHGAKVMAEDQVFLRYLDNRFWIFGTPWHENPDMCSPLAVPLEKLFFLDRKTDQQLSRLSPPDAVTHILQTAFIPFYRQDLLPGIIDRLVLLTQSIQVHSLHYQLGSDPWPLIDRA